MSTIHKIPIGGIKFSEERVHYTATSNQNDWDAQVNDFLRRLHDKQVNLPFLCHTGLSGSTKLSFCVTAKDAASVEKAITTASTADISFITEYDVGSVTVFPHKKQFSFITSIMSLMESTSLPVYSSCNSISAFVFNTRYSELQIVAAALTSIFSLPENHSPFHQQFQLRQPRSQSMDSEV